jgi:hypothetical protein
MVLLNQLVMRWSVRPLETTDVLHWNGKPLMSDCGPSGSTLTTGMLLIESVQGKEAKQMMLADRQTQNTQGA